MSIFESLLLGKVIHSVHVDSEVTYLMLGDGTHIAIRGLVVIEPAAGPSQFPIRATLEGTDGVASSGLM